MIRAFLIFLVLAVAAPAQAQTYSALTGRVVDTANLLDPAQEAALTQRLEALQRASSRQLVVATFPDLQGRSIEEFGVGLGRAWHIGQGEANNGVLLIVGVAERKVRIEVGYGLEGILTDALSGRIIRERITPRFRENDYPGGINAGADAIIEQLQAPPEAAEQRVAAAARAENEGHSRRSGGGSHYALIGWGVILIFFLLPLLGSGLRGRRYRRGPWGKGRVSTWGADTSRRGGSGLGWMIAGLALGSMGRHGGRGGGWGGGGSSWGGGGGFSGGGGGGFSGGGGSFGGGGASGGW